MRKIQQLFILSLFVFGIYGFAAGPQTGGWGFGGNPRPTTASYAFFQAFPTSGAGTNGPCSTTAPTGARGQVLTFTRGSSATCTKTASGGLSNTGIANGDLVILSSNQPRVEYDSAGTLGLLVEASRTNSLLRSQELNNAAWAGAAVSAVVPVVTADAAVQPDGTTTAERLDFPAVSAGGAYSVLYQGVTGTAAAWSASCYVRGVSASGTIYLMLTPGGSYTTTACNYVSTSWTRCTVTATETAAAWFLQIGVDLRDGAQTAKSAQSAYVTDCQWELGAYASSYIPTTSAAVTRAEQAASFPVVINTIAGFSHAHTFSLQGTTSFDGSMGLYQDASNRTQLYQYSGNALNADIFTTSGNRSASFVSSAWATNTPYRIAISYSGAGASSTVSAYLAGALVNTSAAATTSAFTSIRFGPSLFGGSGSNTNTIYTRWCADPNPSRCR